MAIPRYGVWVVRGTKYEVERNKDNPTSPHIHLYFKDHPEGRQQRRDAINVKSRNKVSRLVYWMNKDFTHPLTRKLNEQDYGFELTKRNRDSLRRLNYIRTDGPLVGDIEAGKLVPHDLPGPDSDILDKAESILAAAIKE